MWRTVALIALGVASAEDQHDLSRPSWNLLLEASWNRLEVDAHRAVARAAAPAVPRVLQAVGYHDTTKRTVEL